MAQEIETNKQPKNEEKEIDLLELLHSVWNMRRRVLKYAAW